MVYNIPGSQNLEGAEVALASAYLYYSWQNINAQPLANNTFQIYIPDLVRATSPNNIVTGTYHTITIPDGIYTVTDLNNYFQSWCIERDFYLIDSAGQYVYFFQVSTNSTKYTLQFDSYVLPSGGLPSGYTQPSNGFLNTLTGHGDTAGAFPSTAGNAIGFLWPANFSTFCGFTEGAVAGNALGSNVFYSDSTKSFPTGIFSVNSTTAPQVQPNPVIFLNCNLVSNTYSSPSTFLAPIPGKTSAGGLLVIEPPEYAFNRVAPGQAGQVILSFTQIDGQPVIIEDPDIVVTLIFKDHTNKHFQMGPSNTFGGSSSTHTLKHAMHPQNNQSESNHSALARKFR
jgi:hypothetical protein